MSYPTSATEAAQTYRRRSIETADPIGLIVCALDVACENLAKARAAMSAGNMKVKGTTIDRVSRAVSLLHASLDMEQGAIAQNLERLYIYLQQRIAHGHLHNDDAALEEVAGHLREMAEAWRAASQQRTEVPAPEAQPAQAVTG